MVATGTIHKAAPSNPAEEEAGVGSCSACGQRVKRVPGGQGPTWVHSDSGAVAAPNPSKGVDDLDALTRLMQGYDRQFPHATEFERGSFEYETKKVLEAIARIGGSIYFGDAVTV